MMGNKYRGASSDAIQHHYDVSNEFYQIWLDGSMTYSCALWEADEELAVAQQHKLDFLAEAAHLPKRARVLDIGCGWGSMLRRLVERHEAREVVGLTLSDTQAAAVRQWADNRCDVRVENWIDHKPTEPYDGIISIGAFEHFAKYGMTKNDRVEAYRAFFERCRDMLPPRGRLALQTITKGSNKRMSRETVHDMRFILERIFPESDLPWIAEILEASQGVFELTYARNDPSHYARTCRQWHDNLVARRADAERCVSSSVIEDYVRYLRASAAAFDNRHLGLLRISFESVSRGALISTPTMRDRSAGNQGRGSIGEQGN